jgi:gliding motility-associated-like protein
MKLQVFFSFIKVSVVLLIGSLALTFVSKTVYAQGENDNWCFNCSAPHKGIHFNGANATLYNTNVCGEAVTACISDEAGNLLFSVGGGFVWNANNQMMPNGDSIYGNGIASNPDFYFSCGSSFPNRETNIAILKSPVNHNQYYIIHTDRNCNVLNQAYYTVVDMTLQSGLGDVLPFQKNKLITGNISGGMLTVAKAATCDAYWIVLHKKDNSEYWVYKLDETGLSNQPVISSGIWNAGYAYGISMMNNTDDRIVNLINPLNNGQNPNATDFLETASFDNATGTLNNFMIIDSLPGTDNYATFSPDDSKLYVTAPAHFDDHNYNLYQYNLSLLPNAQAVKSSRYTLDSNHAYRIHRLTPDNRIFIPCNDSLNYFDVINTPNGLGVMCNLVANAFSFPYGSVYNPSFPYIIDLGRTMKVLPPLDTIVHKKYDTTFCVTKNLVFTADSLYAKVVWDNGSTQRDRTFNQAGTYWLYGRMNCAVYVDSIHLDVIDLNFSLGNDTFICEGESLLLDISMLGNVTYKWQDGSEGSQYLINHNGTFSVTVTKQGCSNSDTVIVNVIPTHANIVEPDTTICTGLPILLHADTDNWNNHFMWSNGSTNPVINVSNAGRYQLTMTNECGTFHDSVLIQEKICCPAAFLPSAFSPNGDGINDVFKINFFCPTGKNFNFGIYNRYGQRVFYTGNPDNAWDGTYNGEVSDVGVYLYYLKYTDAYDNKINRNGSITLIR